MLNTLAAGLSVLAAVGIVVPDASKATPARDEPIALGETMPAFELPDEKGEMFVSENALKDGPLIVAFYRGTWCPYCRRELASIEESVADFNKLGANVIAISPQTPEHVVDLREKLGLSYETLVDHDNKLATELGIMFTLDKATREKYRGYGVDLTEYNDSEEWQLPIPATFVIDQTGKVRYAWTNPDYSKRAPVEEIMAALKEIKNGG